MKWLQPWLLRVNPVPSRASRLGPRGQTDMLDLFFTSSMFRTFVRRYSKIYVTSLLLTAVSPWSSLDFAIPAKKQQFAFSWMDLLGCLLLLCDLTWADVGSGYWSAGVSSCCVGYQSLEGAIDAGCAPRRRRRAFTRTKHNDRAEIFLRVFFALLVESSVNIFKKKCLLDAGFAVNSVLCSGKGLEINQKSNFKSWKKYLKLSAMS